MAENSTYLARVPSQEDNRQHERFSVRREAHLISVGTGLSGLHQRRATLFEISKDGAALDVSLLHGLPDHYYLKIVGFPNRLGCAEIYRKGTRVGVKFLATIDHDFLHKIVRSEFLSGPR